MKDLLRKHALETANGVLRDGGVILYPTDSVWGLGCDILQEKACQKIYRIKKRPDRFPFILLVSSIGMLHEYVASVHPRIETLLAYHKRPLTIIYKKPRNLPEYLLAEDGSIGIRVVRPGICRDLVEKFGRPITSTSPNPHGFGTPAAFGEIQSDIISSVDYVLWTDNDVDGTGEPSVIAVPNEKGELSFLRD